MGEGVRGVGEFTESRSTRLAAEVRKMASLYNRLTSRRGYLFSSRSMHARTGNRQAFFRRREVARAPADEDRRERRPSQEE